MLFIRLSWPANVPLPLACGVRRVMSLMRPEIVGSVARSLAADRRRGAGAVGAEDRAGRPDDGDVLGDRRHGQRETEVLSDAEVQRQIALLFGPEPGQRRGDRVRPADSHPRNEEPAVTLRDALVGGPRRLVHGGHRHTRDDRALGILDDAGDGAGGHLRRHPTRRPQQRRADHRHDHPELCTHHSSSVAIWKHHPRTQKAVLTLCQTIVV